MIDSFEEYRCVLCIRLLAEVIPLTNTHRCMRVELCHMHFACTELDFGNVCPACPKVGGNHLLTLDRDYYTIEIRVCTVWVTSQKGCRNKSQGGQSWSLVFW